MAALSDYALGHDRACGPGLLAGGSTFPPKPVDPGRLGRDAVAGTAGGAERAAPSKGDGGAFGQNVTVAPSVATSVSGNTLRASRNSLSPSISSGGT